MDAKPGGAWRTVMRSPDGQQHRVGGVFREIAPPEKLVLTWAWEDDKGKPGHETVITVEFRDRKGSTELVLTQRLFESTQARDLHGQGWTSTFDKLGAFIAETKGG